MVDAELALGVTTEIGVVDDSLEVKVAGFGGQFGRKMNLCALDTCFGVDWGRVPWAKAGSWLG